MLIFYQTFIATFDRNSMTNIFFSNDRKTLENQGWKRRFLLKFLLTCQKHRLYPTRMNYRKITRYGFDLKPLSFIYPYSQNWPQKTKEESTLNKPLNMLFGVFQGSTLRPLLFTIYIGNFFHRIIILNW